MPYFWCCDKVVGAHDNKNGNVKSFDIGDGCCARENGLTDCNGCLQRISRRNMSSHEWKKFWMKLLMTVSVETKREVATKITQQSMWPTCVFSHKPRQRCLWKSTLNFGPSKYILKHSQTLPFACVILTLKFQNRLLIMRKVPPMSETVMADPSATADETLFAR